MSFTTRTILEGLEALQNDLGDLIIASEASVEATSNFVAQSTAQRAKNLIRSSVPAGNVHFRRNPDRYVRASAPGQPPAIDLGTLISSISFKKYATGSAYAYAAADHAATLEFGDDLIAPRPFMQPAFEAALEAGRKHFKVDFEARL